MPNISEQIKPVDLKIEIQMPFELSEHETDTVYNRVEEICGSLSYTYTQFTLELPTELLGQPDGIKNKLEAVYKEIEKVLEDIKKEDRESFSEMAKNIKNINAEAEEDGDVIQIIDFGHLPDHIRVDLEDEDTALVYVDNTERTPLGRIILNEAQDQIVEVQASF